MATSALKLNPDVVDVDIDRDFLRFMLADGRQLAAPLSWFPRLQGGSADSQRRWRIIGNGEGVHWPDLDEDIAVATLMRRA